MISKEKVTEESGKIDVHDTYGRVEIFWDSFGEGPSVEAVSPPRSTDKHGYFP